MRAQRLEPTLAFWVDLLRQLGLLGTVLGIGLSLMYTGSDLTKLLGPLALKVWTTVAGLACSILLSASVRDEAHRVGRRRREEPRGVGRRAARSAREAPASRTFSCRPI